MDMPTIADEATLWVVFQDIELMKRLFALKTVFLRDEVTLLLLNAKLNATIREHCF
jgi:hypothetical protein